MSNILPGQVKEENEGQEEVLHISATLHISNEQELINQQQENQSTQQQIKDKSSI